jgi:ribose 1,5-bisphosphokinase
VPAAIDRDLAAGRAVVVNVSRTIIAEAETRYPNLCVCVVNACAAVRAARLQQRGRESGEDIARRLERAGRFAVTARRVREIDNDGPLAGSVAALVETILACLGNQAAVASAASA